MKGKVMASTKSLRALAEMMRADPECDAAAKMVDEAADGIDSLLEAARKAATAMAGVLCDDLDHDEAQETLSVLREAIAKAENS